MAAPSLYCFPFTDYCMLMTEWAIYWQALGAIATVIFGLFGLYKIFQELRRLNEQRAKDQTDKETAAKLKRTEFFLDQHRRLFDDKELYSVLCLIDEDSPELTQRDMWDKKRKFLTFLEEMALLVRSDQINRDVAFYMFGYYAICVRHGKNFAVGINPSEEHWGLFYRFAAEAEEYAVTHPDGPPQSISL